jgi:pyridoxine 4-dehydrogenase
MPVARLGFGAMQLTGPGVWGQPSDPQTARQVLRRAVDLGVEFIDTADAYGPETNEQLIREALHPYPAQLLVATKAGLTRPGPGEWRPNGRPDHLRRQCDRSLQLLGVDQIGLFQLHRIDPAVPADEQFGVLAELRVSGKVRHVGLSEVSVAQIRAAQRIVPIASVQNHYNLIQRSSEDVVEFAEASGIAFIPWFPLATGALTRTGGVLSRVAANHGATTAQISLAWLLHRSAVMLPIPGTSSLDHLQQNMRAASIKLTEAEYAELSRAANSPAARAKSLVRRLRHR